MGRGLGIAVVGVAVGTSVGVGVVGEAVGWGVMGVTKGAISCGSTSTTASSFLILKSWNPASSSASSTSTLNSSVNS